MGCLRVALSVGTLSYVYRMFIVCLSLSEIRQKVRNPLQKEEKKTKKAQKLAQMGFFLYLCRPNVLLYHS